jgi:hypothetical protein
MDQLELYRGVNEGRGCRKRKAVERDDTDLYSKRAKPCHTEIALEQQRRNDAKAAADEYNESCVTPTHATVASAPTQIEH